MYRYTQLSAIAVAVAMAASGAVAYAGGGHENDALAIANAKISLTQAVAAAEQHANGKATHAEFEHSKQGWIYEVEVVSGAKVFDVKVDADKGGVIAVREDGADHGKHR
ncbi:MAG: PepSY domain-containing protein [Proteobacteria bacterium]|nr:PepSY domain-containing protein [Pseudomonadota bacterium]